MSLLPVPTGSCIFPYGILDKWLLPLYLEALLPTGARLELIPRDSLF